MVEFLISHYKSGHARLTCKIIVIKRFPPYMAAYISCIVPPPAPVSKVSGSAIVSSVDQNICSCSKSVDVARLFILY